MIQDISYPGSCASAVFCPLPAAVYGNAVEIHVISPAVVISMNPNCDAIEPIVQQFCMGMLQAG